MGMSSPVAECENVFYTYIVGQQDLGPIQSQQILRLDII